RPVPQGAPQGHDRHRQDHPAEAPVTHDEEKEDEPDAEGGEEGRAELVLARRGAAEPGGIRDLLGALWLLVGHRARYCSRDVRLKKGQGACRLSSCAVVSIVKPYPELAVVAFIAAFGGQVEPVVGGVKQVDAALVGRVGVVDNAAVLVEGAGALAI